MCLQCLCVCVCRTGGRATPLSLSLSPKKKKQKKKKKKKHTHTHTHLYLTERERKRERGTQSLAHRGPDDSGTILLRDSIPGPVEIGLGNRRLAILDLSPLAHQPMHDAATGNWIVYNALPERF